VEGGMMRTDNETKLKFLKAFFISAIFPALPVWIGITYKITDFYIMHAMIILYGLVLIPLSIHFLKKYEILQKSRLVGFLLWVPYLIYSTGMVYLGFAMLFAIVYGTIFHGAVAFIAAFALIFFIPLSIFLILKLSATQSNFTEKEKCHVCRS
jgi:hypothetical protein